MIRYCNKCSCELAHRDQRVIEFNTEYGQEFRVLCPTCFDMAVSFMTSAYIPEISKTQWELVVHKAKQLEGRSIFQQCKDQIKAFRARGITIPEIAQETGFSNRAVLDILK